MLARDGAIETDEPHSQRADDTAALVTNWKVWPLIQGINFKLMPLQYRVPIQSTCGIAWTLYLSLLNSRCATLVPPPPPRGRRAARCARRVRLRAELTIPARAAEILYAVSYRMRVDEKWGWGRRRDLL